MQLQLNRAGSQADQRHDFCRMIWSSPGAIPKEVELKDLLHDIEEGKLLKPSDEYVRESVELFKNQLADKINGQSRGVLLGKEKIKSVLLVYDVTDREEAAKVREILYEEGFEVFRAEKSDRDLGNSLVEHKFFQCAEYAFVIYGATTEAWTQNRLLELNDWRSLGRSAAFRSVCVAMTGRVDDAKSQFQTLMADLVLNEADSSPRDVVEQFCKHLQKHVDP